MAATPEHYADVSSAFGDLDSLTVLTVAGATRDQVADALRIDLSRPVAREDVTEETTAWSLLEVPGGVVAFEESGFGDPSVESLVALSAGGGAAVVRSNILAHLRFGAARGGELLFDDNEYIYVEELDGVPAELRPLFELAWDDLDSDEVDESGPDGFVVGLAMSELVTGLEITTDHVAALRQSQAFSAPTLQYGGSGEDY